MILYCTTNKKLEIWYLDLTGALARPPAAPTVYALTSFETAAPQYYVGSSRRFTGRLGAHVSFARSRKLRANSAGGQFFAPAVARRRRVLVIILETCPGASTASLQRCEQAWIVAARRDNGAAALPFQVPTTSAPTQGPHAPTTLASRRHWPTDWIAALGPFFREPRSAAPSHPARAPRLNGKRPGAAKSAPQRRHRDGPSSATRDAEARR